MTLAPQHTPAGPDDVGTGGSLAADAAPFLKWAGGKRALLPVLLPLVPKEFGTYYEPFVGGGALFFALRPDQAVLSDANERLIRTYRAVRDEPDRVVHLLHRSKAKHEKDSKTFFTKARAFFNGGGASDADVAAPFIYLNKTCFNGLYRENSLGKFNVPIGAYKDPVICDEKNLRACSTALQGADVRCGDFAAVVARAEPGDLVYFDPPYLPISATSSFTGYTADGFALRDHRRLRDLALELKARGVHVLISNSAAPAILDLYQAGFTVTTVQAARSINSKGSGRGKISELVIR